MSFTRYPVHLRNALMSLLPSVRNDPYLRLVILNQFLQNSANNSQTFSRTLDISVTCYSDFEQISGISGNVSNMTWTYRRRMWISENISFKRPGKFSVFIDSTHLENIAELCKFLKSQLDNLEDIENCRKREPSLAEFGFDTAENEPGQLFNRLGLATPN